MLPSLEGTILDGKYRVDRLVAEGGFGIVYAGRHLALDRAIAIKVLKPVAEDWPDRVAVFLDEARTLAKLRHPNVVEVLDSGATHIEEILLPWMVLEWLDGETLKLTKRTPAECLDLLRPVLEAVAAAHDLGIVHRDIKASNVMLCAGGAKLIDFGIAKVMTDPKPGGETTSTGRSFTRLSAAPEQLSGGKTGPWTDVFALGLLLTELLTGTRAEGTWQTPGKLGVDVGPWEPVLAKALAVNPQERQPNAGELLRELSTARARRPIVRNVAFVLVPVILASAVAALARGDGSHFRERRLTSFEPNRRIDAIALSHDKSRIAFSEEDAVWVQQVSSGERFSIACKSCANPLDFMPGDRELLVGLEDGTVDAIDVTTRARRNVRKKGPPFRLSPDGSHVIVFDTAARIETFDGKTEATLPGTIPPARIDELAWSPSGKTIAFVLGGKATRGSEELVVSSVDGTRVRSIARGLFRTNGGYAGLAWTSDERLLVAKPTRQNDGVTFVEQRFTKNGEPEGELRPVHHSMASAFALVGSGGSVAFISSETQDDVYVAGLDESGTAVTKPFERATFDDSNEAMLDWTGPARIAFLSDRPTKKQTLAAFEQEIGGTPADLYAAGPDIYSFGAAALTGDGRVLFWRGGPGGAPERCQLVLGKLHDGGERVLADDVGDDACRARIACNAGRCAMMGVGSVGWIDLDAGHVETWFTPPSLAGARIISGLSVSRDHRIAVSPETNDGARRPLTILRTDGSIEKLVKLDTAVQSIAFSGDGARVYASDWEGAMTGIIAIDIDGGGVHRIAERDRRGRANPRVSPDGRSLAVTVRAWQTNIVLLEP